MPIYTYECPKCSCKFEKLVSVADRDNLDKIKRECCPEIFTLIQDKEKGIKYISDPNFTPEQCQLKRVVDNFTFKI